MTSISLGFTRGADTVLKTGSPEFHDKASHWQYRLGATQILSPRWLMSANFEVLADDGYLGSPYRVARAFGTTVPERNPRTRTGRAMKFRLVGDLGSRDSMYVGYRYFTRHLGHQGAHRRARLQPLLRRRLAGRHLHALLHADARALLQRQRDDRDGLPLAQSAAQHLQQRRRRREAAYALRHVPGSYDLKLNGALEYTRFKFKDFTDVRTGELYGYSAVIFQVFLSATY